MKNLVDHLGNFSYKNIPNQAEKIKILIVFNNLLILTKLSFSGNYWRVDVKKIPDDKLRRQNTSVSRNVQTGFSYSADLNEVFYIESGKIRRRISQNMLTVHTGITPVLLQPIGDGFVQKPVSHYEEQNAPTILEVKDLKITLVVGWSL